MKNKATLFVRMLALAALAGLAAAPAAEAARAKAKAGGAAAPAAEKAAAAAPAEKTGKKAKTETPARKAPARKAAKAEAAAAEAEAIPAAAEEAPAAETVPAAPARGAFRFGGDFRLRQEALDNVPMKTGTYSRGGLNDYFRFRTRLWAQFAASEALRFNARLMHEVRQYVDPSSSTAFEWPDEVVFDNLNVALKLADGAADVVVGRQDLMFPDTERLLGEGTAKDGSRSGYMDAVAATVRMNGGRTRLHAFAAYDNAVDPLAMGNVDRDLNGYTPNDTGMDEAGAGAFLRQALGEEAWVQGYYLWKHDTAWRDAAGDRHAHEDIHTVGARGRVPLGPEGLSASAEVAGQWSPASDEDRRAMMAAAGVQQAFPEAAGKPFVGVQGLYLSGDDPDTEANEGWNPLWARYPWISELMIYAYDADGAGLWQNLAYGWLEAGFAPAQGQKVKASVGYLSAPEADGAGGGHERGWLAVVRYDFPLWASKAREGMKVYGHLQAEGLKPGGYYADEDRVGFFLRWELTFAF